MVSKGERIRENRPEIEVINDGDIDGKDLTGESEDGRPPMFRLLQFYGVTSAVAFIVISVLLVVADRIHEFDKLINAVERQNVGVARSFANTIWPRFSGFAVTVGNFRGEVLRARPETSELQDAVLQLTGGLPVLRVKVYDRSGRTIYSTEREQIGTWYTNHVPFMTAAAGGDTRSLYFHSQEFSSFGKPLDHRDIVESYLPIWSHDGEIQAVLEIYTDITQDLLLLESRTIETAVTVAMIFATLYIILFMIVARANTVVGRQYACVLQSRRDLDRRNASLVEEVAARERLARNLKTSELRLRSLSDRLIDVQEDERKRVARELHDGIGQGLADIKGRVERAMDFMARRNPGKARSCMESAADAVRSNMEEVRRISMGLRPSILDDLGIIATLSWACRSFRENHPKIEVSQNIAVAEKALPDSVKTVIYRTLQEGLNNIVRHSGANRVRISLDNRDGRVRFTISDNGIGIPRFRAQGPHMVRPTLGVYSLRERAFNTGGTFQLKSIIGAGTTIRLTWPLQEEPCKPNDPADHE